LDLKSNEVFVKPEIFNKYPDVVCAVSVRYSPSCKPPFFFNQSFTVGDEPENVRSNRSELFERLNIDGKFVTFQNQTHSTNINYVTEPCYYKDSDALYTDIRGMYLGISLADCIPIFLYSPKANAVAGIHSGWKGTRSKILTKAVELLSDKYSVEPSDFLAYIGPGISVDNFEVGKEVFEQFDDESKFIKENKFYVDLKKDNYIQLIKSGLEKENIEVSDYCTYRDSDLFHSYRRDKDLSGRMLGVIGLRN
jgi:polyphenol oxidase